MNNDLGQISCELSVRYISYVHVVVVFLILKNEYDRKKQRIDELNQKVEMDIENQKKIFFELLSCDD